jgi:heat shock protein HslJ
MRALAFLLLICLSLPLTLNADIKGKKKPAAKKKITLTNTYWRLAEMNGKKLSDGDQNNTPYIYLQDKKNQLLGHTGCNSIGGEFAEGRYNYLGFEATHTEMACMGVTTEEYMLYALKNTNRYSINGDNLLLYNDNLVLAVFEAK